MDLKLVSKIRSLYSPVQPAVKQSAGEVFYREIFPAHPLQPFIYCYWELKSINPLPNSFTYRVVSDGCVDIYFEPLNPSENYLMGFSCNYTEFPLGNSFHYFGVRFLPAMFPLIFKVDASEFSNCFLRLNDVAPQIAKFIEGKTRPMMQMEDYKDLFDSFFTHHISRSAINVDSRFFNAMNTILENFGVLNVERLDTGLSPRQLRRLFGYYVGDTAKIFSKVVRFQNILRARPSIQSLRQNKLFFDAGYYDQSHFIKDFRNFYGSTPSMALGR